MSSGEATVLAFDLGATSGRAILGRLGGGKLELQEIHRFPNDAVKYDGELHWDVLRLWHEMQTGLHMAGDQGQSLASIGVDTWGVDYALLGENGTLLGNPYQYRDSTVENMEQALAVLGSERVYDATGIQFLPFNTLFQLYAAVKKTPRLLDLAKTVFTIPDLLNYWLTGVVGCEYTNATTTQFLDRLTRTWATGLLEGLGIPTHMLTNIIEPGTVLGGLRAEVSHAAGVGSVPVVAPACHDTGSAVAAIRSGGDTAFLSSGTWSLLGTEVPQAVVTKQSHRFNFTNEGGVGKTYRLLKNITGLWLLEGCKKVWDQAGEKYSYADLLKLAGAEPPLRSLIDPDDRCFASPDHMPQAIAEYCARTGQPAPSTPGAFTRTVLESLAMKYRYVLEQLASLAGTRFQNIRVIGGGCRNALLNQFTADATGCRVMAGPAEATALGNIAMQMVGIGAVGSIDDARDLIARSFPFDVYEPAGQGPWDSTYGAFKALVER